MQQAARVSDRTAFFIVDLSAARTTHRRLVEYGPTGPDLHATPTTPAPRSTSPGSSAERDGRTRSEITRPASASSSTTLERQALGALDIVVEQLDRALEALEHQDVELATFVIADDDRVDGRYLEVHQGDALAARAARRRWPATCGSSRRCCT